MNNALLLTAAIAGLLSLLMSVIMFFALRRSGGMTRGPDAEQTQKDMARLFSANEELLKRGFVELRKELRDMGAEQRAEVAEIFKTLQDNLVKSVNDGGRTQIDHLRHFAVGLQSMLGKLQEFKQAVNADFQASNDGLKKQQLENSSVHSRQLDAFKTSLNAFAEKLTSSFADFKQSVNSSFHASSEALNRKQDEFRDKNVTSLDSFGERIRSEAGENRKELKEGLNSIESGFSKNIVIFKEQLGSNFSDLNIQQIAATMQAKTSLIEIKNTIELQLKAIKEDNSQQLTEMRKTVDEKLQSTLERRLGESFKQVSDRLEQVHKGLGEMQTLAIGVGDLKKVLSNVKTRGMLGEYQLGNILEQILAPGQYATDVAIKQGNYVEFAVKLPGKSDEKTVWLPIDSKFPLSSYEGLLQAYEAADT